MAIASNGPHGHFNGKVGNLVFYMLNGVPVVRTIGLVGKPSKAQQANHHAMAVTSKLLKPMKNFIKFGYGLQAKGTPQNAHNLATSYHKKHALIGEYPDMKVDYSKVVLSVGELALSDDLKMVNTAAGLEISWDPSYGADGKKNDDSVMIMVSYPESASCNDYLNIARRSEGKCLIEVIEKYKDQQIEVYIAFRSANNESISNSAYLGNVNGEKETLEEQNDSRRYQAFKVRYDKVANTYMGYITSNDVDYMNTKAFRHLQKEYQVLKDKLDRLPGKPG